MTLPSRQKNFASKGDVRPWFLEAVGNGQRRGEVNQSCQLAKRLGQKSIT